MSGSIFNRVTKNKKAIGLHAAKREHPGEALCGRPLAPAGERPVPAGARVCQNCQTSYAGGAR